MILKDNKLFEMPDLMGGSFGPYDRLELQHNLLILTEVNQREDNGKIEITTQAKDGPEQKRGFVYFKENNRSNKDLLARWLAKQIGKDIETIYQSDFTFEKQES